MDTNNGGSGVDYPKTLIGAAQGIQNVDVVIPGHSDVTDWKAFQEFGQFMQAFVSATEAAANAGKTAEQAAESLGLPPQFKDYDMGRLKADIDVIYGELKK